MSNNYKTKCDFCQYHTRSGCMAKPDSNYCNQAKNEFYAYLAELKRKNQAKGK